MLSKPNYRTTTFFTLNQLAIEMKKNADSYAKTCLFRTFNTRIK